MLRVFVFGQGWPWTRDHIGPPAGPLNGFHIQGSGAGTLTFVYDAYAWIKKAFLKDFDDNVKLGDKHWIAMWGKLQAGPFNTHCLSFPHPVPGYPHGYRNECVADPYKQKLPPVPTSKLRGGSVVVVKG